MTPAIYAFEIIRKRLEEIVLQRPEGTENGVDVTPQPDREPETTGYDPFCGYH